MTKIIEFLKRLSQDERGISALEYAVLIVVVIGLIVAGADSLGTAISGLFGNAATELTNAGS